MQQLGAVDSMTVRSTEGRETLLKLALPAAEGSGNAAGRLTGRGRPAAVRQLDDFLAPPRKEPRLAFFAGLFRPPCVQGGAGLVRAWGHCRRGAAVVSVNPALATGLPLQSCAGNRIAPLGRRAGRLRRARLGAPSGRPGHAPASSCHSSSCCDLGRCREDRHRYNAAAPGGAERVDRPARPDIARSHSSEAAADAARCSAPAAAAVRRSPTFPRSCCATGRMSRRPNARHGPLSARQEATEVEAPVHLAPHQAQQGAQEDRV